MTEALRILGILVLFIAIPIALVMYSWLFWSIFRELWGLWKRRKK